jgi:hypothetical protein
MRAPLLHRPRRRSAILAITFSALLTVSSAGIGLSANTRLVYFGAPPYPDVCPTQGTTADPAPCGGGIDPATGQPRDGLLYFSPDTISTTTATDKLGGFRVRIGNESGSTLTKVSVFGGTQAGRTTNALNPPPSSRGFGPSLPAGFRYHSIHSVSGPTPACSITGPRTGFRCDFGNIAAGATPTILTIVLQAPSSIPTDPWLPTPWIELKAKEGSSTSGANVDTFYAVTAPGALTVTASTLTYVESFILPAGSALTTRDDFDTSSADPTATRVHVPTTGNGENARIEEIGDPDDTEADCASNVEDVDCFGQTSVINVTTPAFFFQGSGVADAFGIVDPDDPDQWLVEPLRIDFRWDSTQTPGGTKDTNIEIVHDGLLILADCQFDEDDELVVGQPLPCRGEATTITKDILLTVFSDSNGSWKPARS